MRQTVTILLVVCCLMFSQFAASIALCQQPAAMDTPAAKPIVIAEDTPVRLKLLQTLSSGTAKLNDRVDFEVIDPVKIGDVIVIPQGGTAIATVTEARPKRRFGRAGKLNVNIDYVRLSNGDKAQLRAVKGGTGGTRTAAMTTAVVATAIVFFPAAPLFFFMKGKNIIIPKGTEITAYLASDKTFAPAPGDAVNNFTQASFTQPDVATIVIKSMPEAGDVTVDGKFMGNTPSTLKLTPGDHTVKITRDGHKEWSRTITVGPGSSVTLEATLEKTPG